MLSFKERLQSSRREFDESESINQFVEALSSDESSDESSEESSAREIAVEEGGIAVEGKMSW